MGARQYRVELAPAARRQLDKLASDAKLRIVLALRALRTDPRPQGAERLAGSRAPDWRIRVGDYRIIYEIRDDRLLVLVIRVGHRGKVYRLR